MKIRLLFLALAMAAPVAAETSLPTPAPQVATGSWKALLNGNLRPRLLGSKAHLQALAKSKAPLYNSAVKGTANHFLPSAGIVHAVEGLPPEKIEWWLQKARQNMARGATNIHQDTWIWMSDTAQIYDYFYDAIAPAEREKIIAWLNANLDSFKADEGAFHNSTLSKIQTYLRVAYATWGENPRAKEFRDYALIKLYEGKVLPALHEFGDGGGFTEAGWYARHSLWHLTEALELARRVEGYDGFAKARQFFYGRLAYEMFQPYPGIWLYGAERFPVEGDGSLLYGGHTEYPRLMRTLLAQYFRGSELSRAVLNKRRRASNPETAVSDFLWEENAEAPLDLKTFPLAHLASGIGKVYARSDWSDDATWFRFDCGPYFTGHQHFDVGNFEIFRREPLATESGEYYSWASPHEMNYLIRSIAHNVMLIYQPDEKWTMMRDGGRMTYANDGGQAKKWEWPSDNVADWKKKQAQFERGSIIAYENRPEYLFIAADCTPAYAPSKLQKWIRQIVYLRPHTFVIFDRVVSTKPEYEKTWLLHSAGEPQVNGFTSTIASGKGRLRVQTLLPQNAKIHKIHGYSYRGQTFDPAKNPQNDVSPKWRLEVQPPTAQTEDIFLHVLSTEDGVVPTAQLLRENRRIGVKMGDVQLLVATDALDKVGGTLAIRGQNFDLQPSVRAGRFEQ